VWSSEVILKLKPVSGMGAAQRLKLTGNLEDTLLGTLAIGEARIAEQPLVVSELPGYGRLDKVVAAAMQRVARVLQAVCNPSREPALVVQRFKSFWPGGTKPDLKLVLNMQGTTGFLAQRRYLDQLGQC
jgi:hypothetical protein